MTTRLTLLHGGKQVWQQDLPVHVADAVVSDQGHVAAHGTAVDSTSHDMGSSELAVLVFKNDGKLLHSNRSLQRAQPGYNLPDAPRVPRIDSVAFAESAGMAVFRVSLQDIPIPKRQEWWWVSLKEPESIAKASVPCFSTAYADGWNCVIVGEAVIPDTDLVVTHCVLIPLSGRRENSIRGALISVCDSRGSIIWSRMLENEYVDLGPDWTPRQSTEELRGQLSVRTREFEYTGWMTNVQLRCKLRRADDGVAWEIEPAEDVP